MANVAMKMGKSSLKIQNGILYCLKVCNQEGNRLSYSEQNSNQTQEATYGAPEYFEYNEYSFNDIHMEMEKYRLPRPSSKTSSESKK